MKVSVKMAYIAIGVAMFALPLTSLAGQCNYTVQQLQRQLPFPVGKARIVSQKAMNNDICDLVVEIKTPRGIRFVPMFASKNGVIIGTLFRNKKNVTGEEITAFQNKIFKKVFNSIKSSLSEVTIATYKPEKANGKILYAFVDPLCPFCHMADKKLTELADESGYTVKIVPFIVHGKPAYDRTVNFICNHKTFNDWINNKFGKKNKCKKAKTLLSDARNIAVKLGLDGTPTFFTSNGIKVVGADIPKLKRALNIGR